jgi:hypothetical protein
MRPEELIPCPGCGKSAHRRATLCPHCGYVAEITHYQEQLSSLSTICSILTGFGLAGIFTLVVDDEKVQNSLFLTIAVGFLTPASLLFLVVLILSELFRRQEVSENVLAMPAGVRDRFARRCEFLLSVFTAALIGTGIGVLLAGFHMSPLIGCIALGGLVLASLLTIWAIR